MSVHGQSLSFIVTQSDCVYLQGSGFVELSVPSPLQLFLDNSDTISGPMIKRFIEVSYISTCTVFVVNFCLHVQCLWLISTYMCSVCGSFLLTCTVFVVHFHLHLQCLWFISTDVYCVCGSFPLTCTVFVVHFHLHVQCLWFISTLVYSVCASFPVTCTVFVVHFHSIRLSVELGVCFLELSVP